MRAQRHLLKIVAKDKFPVFIQMQRTGIPLLERESSQCTDYTLIYP